MTLEKALIEDDLELMDTIPFNPTELEQVDHSGGTKKGIPQLLELKKDSLRAENLLS